MPWAAGSYTKGNSGTGGWVGDASLGIGIEAGRHDTQDNDFATGINQCLNKDGSNSATGNLNLGGFIPTNIAAGTAAAPAICAGNDVNTGIYSPNSDNWAVATNGVNRLQIDSTGLTGLNCIPASAQFVITSSSNARAALQTRGVTGDVAEPSIDVIKFDNNNTTSQNFIEFYINNAATGSGKITANGASAAAFGTFSDERLKENIENLPSQLANILGLRPVEFDYKNGSGHQIGFVAQEVQQIYPDNVGQDGEYLTLSDMSKNDARLIKAFQELHAKVEALEARVAELEA
jgi:hypothetical protein